jgi:beta-galactosidase
MWSIGNEVQERADSSGIAIANELKSIVKKYDPSRPVTAAICEFWDNPRKTWDDTRLAFEPLEIGGYNYQWSKYENDHNLFPGRIMNGTESTAAERALHWDLVEKHPYIIGDFIWTAIDYLGESGIGHTTYVQKKPKAENFLMEWPWFNAWCGDIDITGNKKPQSALRDVLWNESKIEMLVHAPVPTGMYERISYWGWPDELASWNWDGNEGKNLDVRVFTRYPAVRLYLNGIVIGEKNVVNDSVSKYIAQFSVKYEPGTLKATGLEKGEEKESVQIATSGKLVNIGLSTDRNRLISSKNDLAYVQIVLLDKDGNIVQDNDIKLNLNVTGEGVIAAAGNASPSDMESFRSVNPFTFRGRALVILRPSGTPGTINLKVNASNFPEEKLAIEVRNGFQKFSPFLH